MKLKFLIFTFLIGKLYCQQVIIQDDNFYFPKVDLKAKNTSDIKLLVYHTWEFFEIKDTITVKIIEHIPAPKDCGGKAYASSTIVENKNGDFFRVLGLCNAATRNIKNRTMKIVFAQKPGFDIEYPIYFTEDIVNHKINSLSVFDLLVYRTAWGEILYPPSKAK